MSDNCFLYVVVQGEHVWSGGTCVHMRKREKEKEEEDGEYENMGDRG